MDGTELLYLVARVLSCGIWLAAGLYKITHYEHTLADMRANFVLWPRLVLPPVIALELIGVALLVVDRWVWLVALAWLVFMVPASWLYHFRVMVPKGTIDFPQYITGMKNVSIAGGLFALIALDTSRPAWFFGS